MPKATEECKAAVIEHRAYFIQELEVYINGYRQRCAATTDEGFKAAMERLNPEMEKRLGKHRFYRPQAEC